MNGLDRLFIYLDHSLFEKSHTFYIINIIYPVRSVKINKDQLETPRFISTSYFSAPTSMYANIVS